MIEYAILDSHGLVIGRGEATNEEDMEASAGRFGSAKPLNGAVVTPGQSAFDGSRFFDTPPSPGPRFRWNGREWMETRSSDEVRETNLAALRAERDRLLLASDWTMVADAPLTDAQRAAWRDYRQALRDMPENTENPAAPIWPAKP